MRTPLRIVPLLAVLAVAHAGLPTRAQEGDVGPFAVADTPRQQGKESPTASLVGSTNGFALELYARLADKAQPNTNMFFSPYSIANGLCLAYIGARGETAEQLAKGLQLRLDAQQLHRAFALLQAQVAAPADPRGTPGHQLTSANALWGQKGAGFRVDFMQLAQTGFKADVQEVQFNADPEKARLHINAWFKQQTHGKFPDMLPAGTITPNTEVLLTNAIYFKAPWTRPFSKKSTEELPFQVTAQRAVMVPLMKQQGSFSCYRGRDLGVLELPYAGGELAMMVLLPVRKDGLPHLEKSLTPANLADWTSRLKKQELQVQVPRFRVSYDCELRERLSAMGVSRAFRADADFSGITGKKNFYLGGVLHKAFVAVDEEGTEAAAATASVIARDLPDLIVFRADHPFIFLVRDTRSGVILFLGRLVNPKV